MAIEASISDPLTPGDVTTVLGSHLALQAPAQVRLGLDAASVLEYEKSGNDLVLRLAEDGTYRIDGFFEIGAEGDYSRLLSASDELLAAGIMVPEPEYAEGMPALFAIGAGDSMTPAEAAAPASGPAAGGGDSGGSLVDGMVHLAGAGWLLGSSAVFFSDADDDGDKTSAGAPPSEPETNATETDMTAGQMFSDEEITVAETADPEWQFGAENVAQPAPAFGGYVAGGVAFDMPGDLIAGLEVEATEW